jgi:hypothetical protein
MVVELKISKITKTRTWHPVYQLVATTKCFRKVQFNVMLPFSKCIVAEDSTEDFCINFLVEDEMQKKIFESESKNTN